MSIFQKKMNVGEVKKRMRAFEEQFRGGEAEKKSLNEKLTQCLATGAGDLAGIQRRLSEVDSTISAVPEARRLLAVELDQARAVDARPVLEAVLKKIGIFKEKLAASEAAVTEAWEALTCEIAALGELETPRGWGPVLKIALSKDQDGVLPGHLGEAALEKQLEAERGRRVATIELETVNPEMRTQAIGKLDAELARRRQSLTAKLEDEKRQRGGRRSRAAEVLDSFRQELLQYCSEWEQPLRACLAKPDEPLPPEPLSTAQIAAEHDRVLRGGAA